MRRHPMAIAFVLAFAGALILTIPSGFHSALLRPIVVGSILTAAMTGLVGSGLQFLPPRLTARFAVVTLIAAAAVALVVHVVLKAGGSTFIGPVSTFLAFVWLTASAVALLVARASGMRLPVVHTPRRH